LNRGYAAGYGRWCGSNGSVDERGSASFAKGASVRIWRRKPPAVLRARGGSRNRLLLPLRYPTPTLLSSGFHPWSCDPSLIRRTAVCGPACTACTVVWQGRVGDHSPYADFYGGILIRVFPGGDNIFSRQGFDSLGRETGTGPGDAP
jgi:hypothetical protein